MSESVPPHPVLNGYYIGRMLDLGCGPMYRRQTLQRAGLKPGMRLLDVATGTGLMERGAVLLVSDPRLEVTGRCSGRTISLPS